MSPLTNEQRRNCRILATKILPFVPEQHFNMNVWVRPHPCGTYGCAMGWATMSGLINRLNWGALKKGCADSIWTAAPEEFATSLEEADSNRIVAIVDGERMPFDDAADILFGPAVLDAVFLVTSISKHEAIRRLLRFAEGFMLNRDGHEA